MKDFFNGKQIFLTGHTGFKGSWLALILNELGAKVYGFALPPEKESFYNICNIDDIIDKSTIADLSDFNALKTAYNDVNPDIVLHLAAQPFVIRSYNNPIETMQTNIMGLANLFEAVRLTDKKPKLLLNVTTDKCYENKEWHYPYRENDRLGGHDPYSASKAMAELMTTSYRKSFFENLGIKIITARGGNVIGGGDFGENRIIPDLIRSIKKNEDLVIRRPNSIRPWQHVIDVLYGYLNLVKVKYEANEVGNTSYNIGPDNIKPVNVKELIQTMIEKIGKGSVVINESDSKLHEANYLKLDTSLAKAELNWAPKLNIDNALDLTARWYKAYLNGEDVQELSIVDIKKYFV